MSVASKLRKKQERAERQLELLKHFQQEEDHYEEKKVGEDWYVKMYNGGTNKWQVAVFSGTAYRRYKSFERAVDEVEELDESFKQNVLFERPTLESIKAMHQDE